MYSPGATSNSVKDGDIDGGSLSDSSEKRTAISPYDPSFITHFLFLLLLFCLRQRDRRLTMSKRSSVCTVSWHQIAEIQRQTLSSLLFPYFILLYFYAVSRRAVSYSACTTKSLAIPFTHYLTMKCRDREFLVSILVHLFFLSLLSIAEEGVVSKVENGDKSLVLVALVVQLQHRRWWWFVEMDPVFLPVTYIGLYEKATLDKWASTPSRWCEVVKKKREKKKKKGKAKKTFVACVFIAKRLDWLSMACRSFAILTTVAVPYYNIKRYSPIYGQRWGSSPWMAMHLQNCYMFYRMCCIWVTRYSSPRFFLSPIRRSLLVIHLIP